MDQRLHADIPRIHAQATGLSTPGSPGRVPLLATLRRGKNACTPGEPLYVDAHCRLRAVASNRSISHPVSGPCPLHVGGVSHLRKLLLQISARSQIPWRSQKSARSMRKKTVQGGASDLDIESFLEEFELEVIEKTIKEKTVILKMRSNTKHSQDPLQSEELELKKE